MSKGAPATPPNAPPLAQTVLRALLYLRHGEGDVVAVAQSIADRITAYTEARMNSEQTLDAAIQDLKTAAAAERQAAVAAFARIEAKLDDALSRLPDLGDEAADVRQLVEDAKAAAADYAARHPSEPTEPVEPPPPAEG